MGVVVFVVVFVVVVVVVVVVVGVVVYPANRSPREDGRRG